MSSILKVDTIQDSSGNNIINESSDTITIGASGDTITIPSGATITNSGTATGFGGDNTPAFQAWLSSTQTVSNNTSTKVIFNSEVYDSDSAYDTSTGRFTVPSGEGGKYLFYIRVSFDSESAGAMDKCNINFKKNGSGFIEQETNFTNNPVRKAQVVCPIVLDLAAADYVEVFALIDSSNSLKFEGGSYKTSFGGHKLIGV
jgi:hypothetical protein